MRRVPICRGRTRINENVLQKIIAIHSYLCSGLTQNRSTTPKVLRMVVCSCNRLTHKDVEAAVADGATHPRDIYAARNCKAQCGNCVKGVVCLLREARLKHMKKAEVPAHMVPAAAGVALSA